MKGKIQEPGSVTLEAFVLVSVVSLISLVAVPSYRTYSDNKQAACLAQKFREYAAAFDTYHHQHGSWPEEQVSGAIPAGLEGYLPGFTSETTIGGKWDWDNRPELDRIAITVIQPRAKTSIMERVDRILDDGNLATGLIVYRDNQFSLSMEH